jgi:hypothetical protein
VRPNKRHRLKLIESLRIDPILHRLLLRSFVI